jgi:hypothetical protein
VLQLVLLQTACQLLRKHNSMLGSMMASLEEENEVLLARYCLASFLPQLTAQPHCAFRPHRWLTEEKSTEAALTAHSDGPSEGEDVVLAVQYDEDEQHSPLLALPEELLWLVWELAQPTPEDLCRLSLVCRRFDRIACGHPGLWVPFLPPNVPHDGVPSSSHRTNPKVTPEYPHSLLLSESSPAVTSKERKRARTDKNISPNAEAGVVQSGSTTAVRATAATDRYLVACGGQSHVL